ncbi:hypothetical protein BDV25DRAFT_29257 [Aspergillus avenaceus]|uniref:C2H2-type domain-containing protein n=1 Tax=Aspergillus avenaceus TaxID=36643 RepID=A0A5N6TMS5_ASPAV|nr:hypothetical protein BDV25DRAFT_29257 [Aspergillus avenaceus]
MFNPSDSLSIPSFPPEVRDNNDDYPTVYNGGFIRLTSSQEVPCPLFPDIMYPAQVTWVHSGHAVSQSPANDYPANTSNENFMASSSFEQNPTSGPGSLEYKTDEASQIACLSNTYPQPEPLVTTGHLDSNQDRYRRERIPPIPIPDTSTTASLNTSGTSRRNAQSAVFECKWIDCDSRQKHFARYGDLMRHIRTLHVNPRSIPCVAEDCGEVFNRKDNRDQHVIRKHPELRT